MKIGLCGKPQSGKTEVRSLLVKHGFTLLNTKEPIAEACSILTGLEKDLFFTSKNCLYKGVPLRKIMGEVQLSVENLFGDYHVIEEALQDSKYRGKNVVVDALRKTQTVHFDGTVVEVVSDRGVDTGYEFDLYERGEDGGLIDYRIVNDGDILQLEDSVKKLLSKLHYYD